MYVLRQSKETLFSGFMHFQGRPRVQNLATRFTGVGEAAHEVLGLHVVPHIAPAGVGEPLAYRAEPLVGFMVLHQKLIQIFWTPNFRKVT